MNQVLKNYFSDLAGLSYKKLTSGLINKTYYIKIHDQEFILQAINTQVFKNPAVIINNILKVREYLLAKKYPKNTIELVPNLKGDFLTHQEDEAWRLVKFISQSICFEKVQSVTQAYEAAKALSEFHSYLFDFPIANISASIPGFLDYQQRIQQFYQAILYANTERLINSNNEINLTLSYLSIVDEYLQIKFPLRIVHADAKISNFLFDAINYDKVVAVIDWDTILPGNILCDFGDMIRTYANLKAEDDASSENNFSIENYFAIKKGFLTYLEGKLTDLEIDTLDLTAKVVILVQAIRFLTDYLMNDSYYNTEYSNQNLYRARNQLNLLQAIIKNV